MGEGVLTRAILHFAPSVVGSEGVPHDMGLINKVVLGRSKSLACVGFVGNRELSPRDPELVGYTGFVAFAICGGERCFGIGVPCKLAKPMSKSFPCVVGDRIWITIILKVDVGIAEVFGVDSGWVVDVGVPARTIILIFVGPWVVRVHLNSLAESELTASVRLLVDRWVIR